MSGDPKLQALVEAHFAQLEGICHRAIADINKILDTIPKPVPVTTLHNNTRCIGTPGQLCTCPCLDCISNCVRKVPMPNPTDYFKSRGG